MVGVQPMSHEPAPVTPEPQAPKRWLPGFTFLRFAACVLITNSHLDSYYPIAAVATGGSLGNSLFFALSGYGLAISRSRALSFGPWLSRRLERVYPTATVMTVATLLIWSQPKMSGVLDAIAAFIYPTPYWFVAAVVPFYIGTYFVLKKRSKALLIAVALAACIPYAALYLTTVDTSVWTVESAPLKYFFYWQMMMLGTYLGMTRDERPEQSPVSLGVVLAACLLVYAAVKLALGGALPWEWQFLAQVATFPIIAALMMLFERPASMAGLMRTWIGRPIALIGGLTLEVYVVQNRVLGIDWIGGRAFPLNVILFIAGTLLAAYLLNQGAKLLLKAVKRATALLSAA